uniref:YaiI/YqxD family protein n=1 Tax=Gemmiger formicilis TaxID=745368 RepID=UPI003FED5647
MTILIDADGCPVVDLTLQTAAKYNVPVLILCDTAHQIQRDGAQTLTFGKGADSVDFALVNRVCAGDLVITQDYGLASMCLARCALVLNQNGLEYTPENIDGLLFRRHKSKKLLRAGKHPKGASKRTKEQNITYRNALERILQSA